MKACMKRLTSLMLALTIIISTVVSPIDVSAASAYPEWSASATYEKGEKVTYNGKTYEAKWWTTNESPDTQWGPWEEVEEGDTPTNTAPTLSGVKDQTVSLGTAFDPLNGVSANDAEDGNLTAKIIVTGTVNVNAAGTYPLTYTVTDNGGLTATASCTITVTSSPVQPTVTPEPSINFSVSLTASNTAPKAGDKVKLTAAADSGTAPYRYSFAVLNETTGTKSYLVNNSTRNFLFWNCLTDGKYTVEITCKDANGNVCRNTLLLATKTEGGGDNDDDKTEPPVPFWKNYRDYPTKDTEVYYKGKIYKNKWYANAGVAPDSGDPWVLVGDAEWTVPEDEKNYERDTSNTDINKILTDKEIETLYGGIKEEYSPEAALGRLNELIPKDYYEELFPYRFGSDNWKNTPSARSYYGDKVDTLPDYYSYENLQAALSELSDTIIKVQWFEGASWCYRLIRLNKSTKEQKLIFMETNFESYMDTDRTMYTSIVDYGSFLAVGDLNTRKRELAGFLANISHETGGGNVDGVATEDVTGLYFNEEVGFIGSSAIGYVQGSGTQYLPVAGKSYHGRGPIQLSYNFNYGLCSDVLYGDSSILLNNPEKVCEDGVLGFMTGIWFWMTPQPPKPSCHEVITGIWEPIPGAANADYNGNFGLTIIIINNEAGQSETGGKGAVVRRAKYYRMYAAKMGADITGEHCDTVGMTTFTS